MGQVLEFESARLQLHRLMLRELGVPDPFTWRVLGRPRDRFWDGCLYAAPWLVAIRRDGKACTVDITAGNTPNVLGRTRLITAALDAAVVKRQLERHYGECYSICSWVVFDDGGRFELNLPDQDLMRLRERAQRALRDNDIPTASTRAIAPYCEDLVQLAPCG